MLRSIFVATAVLILGSCEGASAPETDSSNPPTSTSASPSPSHDSDSIAELRRHRVAFMDGSSLFTARADGSARQFVARISGAYAGAAWSARARAFVIRVEREVGDGEIHGYVVRISADGSSVVNLSERTGSGADAMVGWSPDGRRIAFISTRDEDTHP